MKKKNSRKIYFFASIALALVLTLVLSFFAINKFFPNKNTVKNLASLDMPDYSSPDSAISYYTLKWLDNIKFTKKGILSRANIQTTNEGIVVHRSFKTGKINVDKKANVNYPFVVRIQLSNEANNTKETLYFSQIRYDKAQIFRTKVDGSQSKTNWEDIKEGDYIIIEESIDLLIPNVDSQNNFTDKYLKSLTIHLK
jgi:hypothetical protein